jgi:hypothetical protein
MSLIAGLLGEFLGKTGGIQAFLIRHISRAKISVLLQHPKFKEQHDGRRIPTD